jgi:hypothetical protein
MGHHRSAAHIMQDFLGFGIHPGTLSGSQDNNSQFRHHRTYNKCQAPHVQHVRLAEHQVPGT